MGKITLPLKELNFILQRLLDSQLLLMIQQVMAQPGEVGVPIAILLNEDALTTVIHILTILQLDYCKTLEHGTTLEIHSEASAGLAVGHYGTMVQTVEYQFFGCCLGC